MDESLKAEVCAALEALGQVLPRRGRVLIVPHDYPDPDALASAAGLQLLLARRWKLRGQIVFSGAVSRAENIEMLTHFRYKWRLVGQLATPRRAIPALFVDTTPGSGNVDVPAFAQPVGVFDHHVGAGERVPQGCFAGVVSGMGATTTLVFEYLEAAGLTIPKWLASVMVYAIATETMDLMAETRQRDLDAYAGLLPRCNFKMLGEIRHAPLPRAYYAQLAEAMQNACTYGRVAWSHLDTVRHPEIVPEIADLLLRMRRITWAFCTGFVRDRLIVSVRSSQPNARCERLIKRRIGKNASAGGHNRMAAGAVELADLSQDERCARRDALVKALLAGIEGRVAEEVQKLVPGAEQG